MHDRWNRIVNAWYAIQLAHYGGRVYSKNIPVPRCINGFNSTSSNNRSCAMPRKYPTSEPDGGMANKLWVLNQNCLTAKQVEVWLGIPGLSSRQMMVFCASTGLSFVAVTMVTVAIWVFPVPFFIYVNAFSLVVLIIGFLRVVMGRHFFREIFSRLHDLRQLDKVGMLVGFMTLPYKFRTSSLTVTSYSQDYHKEHFCTHFITQRRHDTRTSRVDCRLFDALYIATFMATLSLTSVAGILGFDLLETMIELLELHHRTKSNLAEAALLTTKIDVNINLLSAVRLLRYKSETIQVQLHEIVQVKIVRSS
ncbi:Hypothetical protein PHPALM_14896 [Phytophthora palmivora]|uniref:Uncharacterized protein n=1 Tax=Phytophthora palmivora TaxID=4796 RepID=A0A2P4XTJ5_9STRA|nr:Hypothetical protein PHPALM_14896 [Phytophthora palmivora]